VGFVNSGKFAHHHDVKDDLIPDSRLAEVAGAGGLLSIDALNHDVIAKQVASIIRTAAGYENVAVFGPWGSGKSSLFDLIKADLGAEGRGIRAIDFDAWTNAGDEFRINFLSRLGESLGIRPEVIAEELYESKQTNRLPFRTGATAQVSRVAKDPWFYVVLVGLAGMLAIFMAVAPATWLSGFVSVVSSAAVLLTPILSVTVVLWLVDFASSTVTTSTPSSVYQFSQTLEKTLARAPNQRIAVLVDELDRCEPLDIWRVLEGLRTFLKNDQLVFVVAFDRSAVERAVAQNSTHHESANSNSERARPSEYLDKIFQYQLALPARAPTTWVPYARTLVSANRGLWATFDDDSLSEILHLLVPRHTTTPRRVKTLLNDFVLLYRTLESLRIVDRTRAREVATLVVLRKDFPEFAADIERNPALLRVVTGHLDTENPDTRARAEAYRTNYSTAVGIRSSSKRNAERPDARLDREFSRYRTYLSHSDPAVLPRADVIRMSSSQDLDGLVDTSLVDYVDGVLDLERSATVRALSAANDSDLDQCLDALVNRMKGNPATAIASICATIAATLASRQDLFPGAAGITARTLSLWSSQVLARQGSLNHLSPDEVASVIELLSPAGPVSLGQDTFKAFRLGERRTVDDDDLVFLAVVNSSPPELDSQLVEWCLTYAAERLSQAPRIWQKVIHLTGTANTSQADVVALASDAVSDRLDQLLGELAYAPDAPNRSVGTSTTAAEARDEFADGLSMASQMAMADDPSGAPYAVGVAVKVGVAALPEVLICELVAGQISQSVLSDRDKIAVVLACVESSPGEVALFADCLVGVGAGATPLVSGAVSLALAIATESGTVDAPGFWRAIAILTPHAQSPGGPDVDATQFAECAPSIFDPDIPEIARTLIKRALGSPTPSAGAKAAIAALVRDWWAKASIVGAGDSLLDIMSDHDRRVTKEAIEGLEGPATPPSTWREAGLLLALRSEYPPGTFDVLWTPLGASVPEPLRGELARLAATGGAPAAICKAVFNTPLLIAQVPEHDWLEFSKRTDDESRTKFWTDARALSATPSVLRAIAAGGLARETVDDIVGDPTANARWQDRGEAVKVFLSLPVGDNYVVERLSIVVQSFSGLKIANDLTAIAEVLLSGTWTFEAGQRARVKQAVDRLNALGKDSTISQQKQTELKRLGLLSTVRKPSMLAKLLGHN
jgi:hypothetical protein